MKEFVTAVKRETEPEKGVTFTLVRKETTVEEDGTEKVEVVDTKELTAFKPKDGQVAMLMARIGRHSATQDKIAGIIDFFVEVLDEDGHQYVVNRLLDRHDEFGVEDVTNVIEYLMEEWGGRPTR